MMKPSTKQAPLSRTSRYSRFGDFRLALCALVVMGSSEPASAQLAVGVTPLRAELSLGSGEVTTDVVVVENHSDQPVRMSATVADWYLSEDGDPTFVKPGDEPEFSMSDWVEVNPTAFEVPAASSLPVRYTVTVPADVAPAGYRTAILIESVPNMEGEPRPNVAYLKARIGVIIYNTVGVVPIKADILSQGVVPHPDSPTGLSIRIVVRNSGPRQFRVSGEALVVEGSGRMVETVSIQDAVILPLSKREFLLPLAVPTPPGGYTVTSRLDVGLPTLLEAETRVMAAERK